MKSLAQDGGRHPLLARQIRRHLGDKPIPEVASGLLDAIDDAYRQNDIDRAMLERSLEISSQELLEANSQMRAMLQATPDVFLHVGIDGRLLDYKSDPLIDLFCTRSPEGDGRRSVALKPELCARFNAAVDELIGGQLVSCFDVMPAGARGRVYEIRIVMLFLDQAVIYIRDVTEQRTAEVQLRESEERYRSLFDSNPHPMWVYDAETLGFLAVNDAAVKQYGYSREEFLAMTLRDIRPPDRVTDLLQSLVENPETGVPQICGVFRHSKKDGSEIEAEIARSSIVFRGKAAGLVLAMDVTQKRRMEAERETMQRQLEQAHRISSLGHLAATMAHEFNNVLMGIQPFVEVISRDASSIPSVEKAVGRIGSSIQRGKRVTGEILSFTRQTRVIRKPIVMQEWLGGLEAEARAILGPAIDLRIDAAHELVVAGDAPHLQQVFLNLLTNARDAMGGTGMLALSIQRGSGSGVFSFGAIANVEAYAHCTVTDLGAGISDEALKHIFEPLFTTKHSGTGLGLALTQRIVEQHDGRIFIESERGRGTTVHVFLPLGVAAREPENVVPPVMTHGIHKLVLVEDDGDVVAGMAMLLEHEGIEIAIARTGAEAVGVIARTRPDAVLLDVGLPDVSGVDVYALIAERWPALPVIFATGHADMSRLHDLTSKPHVGYLLKPYQRADLVNMLRAVLQNGPRLPVGRAAETLQFPPSELPIALGAALV
ncbi:MAG: ATP-binding protein [Acidobacteriota bacterium]|nr:ATP-binding protein [Acidobacteriota bacterium]